MPAFVVRYWTSNPAISHQRDIFQKAPSIYFSAENRIDARERAYETLDRINEYQYVVRAQLKLDSDKAKKWETLADIDCPLRRSSTITLNLSSAADRLEEVLEGHNPGRKSGSMYESLSEGGPRR